MKKQVLFAAILAGLLLASVVFAVARPKDEDSESSTEAETTETETTPTETQPASGETSAETTGTSAIEDADRIYRGFLMDCNYTILMENQDTMRCITEKYQTSLGNVLDSYHSQSISLDKSFEKVLRIKNEKTFRSNNGRKHLERTAGARRRNARIVRGIRRQIHLGIVGVCVVRGIRNKRSHFAVCIQNCDAAHDVVLFEVGIDVVLQLRI